MIDGALVDIRRDGGIIHIEVRDEKELANLATLSLLVQKIVQGMAKTAELKGEK